MSTITLGSLELSERIGRGGMGDVWLARSCDHALPVAVKVLSTASARNRDFRESFRREVRAAAALDHPGIVQVYDAGEVPLEAEIRSGGRLVGGSPWLAMEHVGGGTLAAHCGHVQWSLIKELLLSLLAALAHAHARGVLHRDLKPGNVLLGAGLPKLSDFGLAHPLDGSGSSSESILAGTFPYMAPEQFEGEWRSFGPSTDLYGLGCLAWAVVTGHPPFVRDNNHEIARAHLAEDLPVLQPATAVPEGLEEWLRLLLAKDPAWRFQRAADAAAQLRSLGEPVPLTAGTGSSPPTQVRAIAQDADVLTVPLGEPWKPEPGPPVTGAFPQSFAPPPPPVPETWREAVEAGAGVVPGHRLGGTGLGIVGLRPVPLVGRLQERDRLWDVLQRAARRGPQVAVLLGPEGYGKSRLARWLCERAHETGAATTLKAVHGSVSGRAHGLTAMLGRFLRTNGLERADLLTHLRYRVPMLRGASLEEIMALAELLNPAPESGPGDELVVRLTTPVERQAVVRRLVRRLAQERPVILWLEDVEWGSLALGLAQTLMDQRDTEHLPVLVLMTASDLGLAQAPVLADRIDQLLSVEGAVRLNIGPLAPEERPLLVRELLGLDGELAARVEERMGGNPLFAVQLVGEWVQQGVLEAGEAGYRLREGISAEVPDSLRQVWATRLDVATRNRPFEDALALELAAVLGLEVDTTEWREACLRAGIQAPLGLVEVLVYAGLARTRSGGLAQGWYFPSALLRECLLDRAQRGGRLATLHRAAAEMVAVSSQGADGDRLGLHLLRAGRLEEALEPLFAGASRCLEAGRLDRTELLLAEYCQALDGLDAPRVDPRRARSAVLGATAARLAGRLARAQELALAAEGDARANAWQEILAAVLVERAMIDEVQGAYGTAVKRLAEAISLCEATGDEEQVARCKVFSGLILQRQGRLRQALTVAQEGLSRFDALGNPVGIAHALYRVGLLLHHVDQTDAGTAFVEQARGRYASLGLRSGVAQCLNALGEMARAKGRLEDAERFYREALERYEALDSNEGVLPTINLGLTLVERGRYGEASRIIEASLGALRRQGWRAFYGAAQACLLPCAASAGDWARFDTCLAEAVEVLDETGMVDVDVALMAERAGELAGASGQLGRAEVVFDLAGLQWLALDRDEDAERVAESMARLAVRPAEPKDP